MTGRAIMQAAAKSNLKTVSLELGGKSPLLVFDDADLPATAAAAVKSITFNSGQICTASSRVYVQKGAADTFKGLIAEIMRNLCLGDPNASSTNMGPQADSKQAASVAQFLEAGAKGGQALVGGKPAFEAGENFIHPTVFSDIPDKSKLDAEEIFGPVMVLHEFETEKEAVRRANDTEYGLYVSVFTKDVSRAMRVARALEAGNVGVNCTSPDGAYELPFGGWKGSGIGYQKGSAAVMEWTQGKSVYINHA